MTHLHCDVWCHYIMTSPLRGVMTSSTDRFVFIVIIHVNLDPDIFVGSVSLWYITSDVVDRPVLFSLLSFMSLWIETFSRTKFQKYMDTHEANHKSRCIWHKKNVPVTRNIVRNSEKSVNFLVPASVCQLWTNHNLSYLTKNCTFWLERCWYWH
jgi:hypothetical protein